MSTGKQRFRQLEVRRVVKAVEGAGLKISRVEIDKDGKIAVIPDNGTSETAPEKATEIVL
jgi:hypothetical protein